MPREKGRKGTNGGRNLETLVKLAAPAIGTAAGAFTVVGIIYLGMTLAGLLRGGRYGKPLQSSSRDLPVSPLPICTVTRKQVNKKGINHAGKREKPSL
jgi:hypothetical protein